MDGLIGGMVQEPEAEEMEERELAPSGQKAEDDAAQWLALAMDFVHGRQTRGSVGQMLKGKDPVQALANATVMVVKRIDAASRQKGIEVEDAVKLYGAHEICTQLAEVGNDSGAFQVDEKLIELAFSVAVQEYVKGEIADGRIDPARLQAKVQQSVRNLPPEQRAEANAAVKRIAQTADEYGRRGA